MRGSQKSGCIYKHPHDHECRNQDDMRAGRAEGQEAIEILRGAMRGEPYGSRANDLFRRLDEAEGAEPRDPARAFAYWFSGQPRTIREAFFREQARQLGFRIERRAALPEPSLDVDVLANIIRQEDGNHSLGAGALAERIVARLRGKSEEPKRDPHYDIPHRCPEDCPFGIE